MRRSLARVQLLIFREILWLELIPRGCWHGHRLIMVYSERARANGEYDSSLQECCVSILKIIMQTGSPCNRLITEAALSLTPVNANYFRFRWLCTRRPIINPMQTNYRFFVSTELNDLDRLLRLIFQLFARQMARIITRPIPDTTHYIHRSI